MGKPLNNDQKSLLLRLARQALEDGVNRRRLQPLDLENLPPELQEQGATFVTLTERGALRGCVGALEAYLPLAEDVRQHAVAAALEDYRFLAVQPEELPGIEIEISRLSKPEILDYNGSDDLLAKLRPGIDGVILKDGSRRATFLPQVWEKLPDKEMFLAHLCSKMGSSPDAWRQKKLVVMVYQVEEFHE